MKLIDFYVSKESFELIYLSDLDMYATFPVPDENNLGQYYKSDNYISHTDSNKSFIEKLYKFIKRYTISSKIRIVNQYKTGNKNILDIGCGTGDFLSLAKNKGWQVAGVEPNEKARNLSQLKLNSTTSVFQSLDELISSEHNLRFNVITLWHVLEHVPNYDDYIQKIKKLLDPDGILIVAVPNFKSYDANYYKQYWAAYDVPRHLWHFSKNAVRQIFKRHQMQVVKTIPMYFDSFYVSILSEKYKTGNSNYIKAFIIGFLSNLKAIKSHEFSSQIFIIKNEEN